MPEWLVNSFGNGQIIHLDALTFRLALAFLLGGVVAAIYWLTHRRDETYAPSFVATLVLLAILIAMITQVIGDNVARAFSLVGALSIVRFRTVVEDTRDTAFVIFAVIVGMAVGAGHVEVALVGLVIVGLAAAVMRPRRANGRGLAPTWELKVRIGIGHAPEELLAGALREHFDETHLLEAATGRQGTTLDLTYRVRLRPPATPVGIVGQLNRLEGVQDVDLRRL